MYLDNSGRAPRKRLTDILNGTTANMVEQWKATKAAAEFAPLPAGTYEAHLYAFELHRSRTKGTPGVKLIFRVCQGPHAGRLLFRDSWLTEMALPQTKRDLQKLGLNELADLERTTIPPGRVRCKLCVTLQSKDDGIQYNKVRTFEVISFDDPADKPDPFAPQNALPEANGGSSFANANIQTQESDGTGQGGAA